MHTNGTVIGSGFFNLLRSYIRHFAHERKLPAFVRFSTMNGAPHLGHGSLIGSCGDVKSQSG